MENNNYLCTENNEYKPFMDFKETFKRYNTNTTQMAIKMGLSQQNLQSQIARGTINIKQLEQMAEICGVTLGEFVGAGMPKEITITSNGQNFTYQLK